MPDEAIFSKLAEDCLAPVGFIPAGFAMTKEVMTKWRNSGLGEGRLRAMLFVELSIMIIKLISPIFKQEERV